MSVSVQLEELREQMARYGSTAYLLTVNDDDRPHVVSVAPRWDGETVVVEAGSRSSANASARAAVSILWPAIDSSGFSLIVDGAATVRTGASEDEIAVQPSRAVLHRSRAAADADETAEGATCVTVLK
jgi:hypothetical protein